MQTYNVSRLPSMIKIGYDGENNWRPHSFDCSALLANHPNGTISLWLLPHGETQAFPVALTRDGNSVVWTPLSEEMTAAAGALQLVCTDGTDVGKSAVMLFRVDESIIPGAEHPAAVPSWATQAIERAEDAADRAEEAAQSIDVEHLEQTISAAVEAYLIENPVEITVDDALSDTSENPVQNKVINAVLNQKGTYSKPSDGIPETDLTQAIQTILNNVVLLYSQTLTEAQKAQARQNIDAASIADLGTVFTLKGGVATVNDLPQTGNSIGDVWYVENVSAGFIWITSTAYPNGYWEELGETIDMSAYIEKPQNPTTNYVLTWNGSAWVAAAVPSELPTVTAADNGKFLRVVSGAWAAETVPSAESNSFGGGA